MSALIAGIDFSSKAIHAALISLDADDGSDAPPVTLRSFVMPTWRGGTTPAFRSVERCRVVRDAMRELLADVYTRNSRVIAPGEILVLAPGDQIPGFFDEHEVVHVCVEEPFGASRKADNVMRELYGAILASIPPHIERETITTQEWRRIHELEPLAGDWKYVARLRALQETGVEMDEHQAEAYLIARACRTRLDKAFAA